VVIAVFDTLRSVCRDIRSESKSDDEWSLIESDDMFQRDGIEGGYDADERAFCFSTWIGGSEYWFQLTLADVEKILDYELDQIKVRPAEKLS